MSRPRLMFRPAQTVRPAPVSPRELRRLPGEPRLRRGRFARSLNGRRLGRSVGSGRRARAAAAACTCGGARAGPLGLLLAVGNLVAVVDPHLHADRTHGGASLGGAEVDLRAEGVQRDATLPVPLLAAHLGPAETTCRRDPHPERAGSHRGLDGPSHRAAERHASDELFRDALGEERGIGLGPNLAGRLVHVLDLHVDPLLRVPLDVLAESVDLDALAADHDAGTRGSDEDPDLVALALDVDGRDAGSRQPGADVLADPDVLVEVLGVITLGVPVALPRVDHPEPKSVRMDLVSH